jgi:hypothetical protein
MAHDAGDVLADALVEHRPPRHQLEADAIISLVAIGGKADMAVTSADFRDAVDGAHSAASECHRVVALKQTTLRGAVHG